MKLKITTKHITLAIGILVALLAALMFLVNDFLLLQSHEAVSLPSFTLPRMLPVLFETVTRALF